jgi:hypothetical protein
MSMKMAIFDSSFDNEMFLPMSMAVLEDESYLGMVLRILLRQIDLGSFHMVAARSIILTIIFPDVMSLTMVICVLGSPTTSIRLFDYFFLIY